MKQRDRKILDLWNSGCSSKKIQDELGLSSRGLVMGVIDRAKRKGVIARSKRTPDKALKKRKPTRPRKQPILRKRPIMHINTMRGIDIVGLRSTSCRWPMWGDSGPHIYCGQLITEQGTSYCPLHTSIARG